MNWAFDYFSAVEDAVDVLDELLVVHLAVVEEEDVVAGRLRRLLEDALQRVAPLLHAVLFAHLELEFNLSCQGFSSKENVVSAG